MPKISLITVCKNSEKTIEETLQSVSSQSFSSYEHIVVDGVSSDATLSVVENWKGHKIRWVSQADDGIYHAMNKGIRMARGDVIGFLNSDDTFSHEEVLRTVAEAFKDEAVEACYADLIYVDRDNAGRVVRRWNSCPFTKGAFAKGWCPPHPTFYVRRSVYEKYGVFNQNIRFASDIELMMRFLEKYRISAKYIPGVWIVMRTGGQSTKNVKNVCLQNLEILAALRTHGLGGSLTVYILKKLEKYFKQCRLD